ncbi:LOW QUALITY PROTEIN: uncharacterized protein LOC130759159 [Actinidia eriantha]|uniref:LOW QUALITY PROTEIN: uncharacterized protein LOC130759159 n=1 Tax=Actinidia eriantha TaxID=165200 RepID=UPI00258C4B03|nr:LOW QUALITY PROTEIN: uncharacterized protein LOC130759159 [Actinidia eriantha]
MVFDRSQFDENPFLDPPRVNWGPLGFDRGPAHHDHSPFRNRIHESPFRVSDNHSHRDDLEGSFRVRDDFMDGFKPNHVEEFLRGPTEGRNSGFDSNYRHIHDRNRYGSNSGGSSRGFTLGDSHIVSDRNISKDFGSNVGNYQSRHGSASNSDRIRDNREENRRWGHARPTPRRLSDAPVESDNNEFSNTDGIPVVSSRRVPLSYDSGKFSYRGSREGNHKFRQNPRKKIERKSVLDRIQFCKSYKRYRNDEQYFPSACSDDSGPNNFRARGPFVHPDDQMAEDREGSPVELDVSFKSNALVAKAIVASSSHEVESNRNLTPISRNIRKFPEPVSDLLNLPLTILSDGPVKLNSSTFALDCPTISFENSKQLGDNAKDSSGGAVSGIGSQPCSRGTNGLPGSTAGSDKSGNTTGSGGTSSLRNRNKKKVISSISRVPSSQTAKKNFDPVRADSSMNSPAKLAGMTPVHNVDVQPSPNEVTAVSENNKANESTAAIVSETDGIDIDSGGSCGHNSKRTRTSSTHIFGSPSPLKITVDKGTIVTDRSVDLHAILNSDEGPSGLQNGSTFTGGFQVGDLGQQFFQNEPPLLLQNGLVKGCGEAKLSMGSSANTGFSSPEEIRIHGDPVNLCSTIQDMRNGSGSDNGFIGGQLKNTVTNIDAAGPGSEFNDAAVLPESVEFNELPRAVPSVEGNAIVRLSSAEETNIHESVFDSYGSNYYATTSSGSDNVPNNSQWLTLVSGIGFLDDNRKEACPDGTTVLLENITMEGPPEARMPVRGNLRVGFGKGYSPKKRKDRDTHLDLSSPRTSGMPEKAVNILHPVHTTVSCPVKDLSSVKNRKVCAPVSPSPMLSENQEDCVRASSLTFSMELLSNTDRGLMQSEDRVVNHDVVCSSRSPPCSESTSALRGNMEAGAHDALVVMSERFTDNASVLKQDSPSPSRLGYEQKEKDARATRTMNNQIDSFDTERGGSAETVAAATTPEPGMLHIETVQQRNPSETQTSETDQWQPLTDMEYEGDPLVNGASTTSLHNETAESVPDNPSNMDSTYILSIVTGSQMFNSKISGQGSNEKVCEDTRKQDENLVFEGISLSCSLNAALKNSTINKKSSDSVRSVSSVKPKFGPQDPINTSHSLNSVSREGRKNPLTSPVPRVFPSHPSLKKTAPSSQIAASRTWHRSGNAYASSHLGKNSYPNAAPPQGQPTRNTAKDQNSSYIRKGNSLVRKPPVTAAPNVSHAVRSSVYRLNSTAMDETKKRTGLNTALERPKTPPLPCSTKLSNYTTFSSGNGTSSPLADPTANGCSETKSDPLQHKDMDLPKPSEEAPNSSGTHGNETGQINNNETQSVQEDGNSVSIKSKQIVYVKRKSNQLVATSSSSDRSLQKTDKTEALSSDSYYKRRKNQIIRKLSQVIEKVSSPNERKRDPPATTNSFSRRRSDKGIGKTYKPSKFSLVWTLRDAESLKKGNTLIHHVWPHLFPWKRATHWRSLMHISPSIFNNNSLSTISRKLLLSRKRETVYTRSTLGFSLRKSKVLSVGGSSLKWSKSIERNSKKANEEATLAVAAVEKKKRERNGAGTTTATAGTKNRNRSSRKSVHSIELRPGERIFRVGSVRYKMDPTRRTLQRISDEELSNSVALQSGKDVKKSSVPKRLLIGNDEYVRIGNGNQLIRDPKKRTRMLASEKVRWSLHTARLRLARKKKYCQFFTRFGKCNKDDGKCPYIHDPSKIAVCTKFLKGSCSDPNCKLTHKVIPERMQDCSYFLQGLCTNESCPYRHVNVNPNASVCEGFLRGYCADGNECRKKHSYVCPTFEERGICTQGSKCKLHHPKNQNKGKKKKPSATQKNTRGRYFGSNISECRTAVSEKHSTKNNDDIFCQEGKIADYIHLDFSDEEAEEINDPASERTISPDGDITDMELDVDELIKPFNAIKRSMTIESSRAEDSPSEKTASNISGESSCKYGNGEV